MQAINVFLHNLIWEREKIEWVLFIFIVFDRAWLPGQENRRVDFYVFLDIVNLCFLLKLNYITFDCALV